MVYIINIDIKIDTMSKLGWTISWTKCPSKSGH